MYPTAGPSRSNPNPLAAGRGLTGSVPPPRGGSSRRDVDFDRDREDWTGGYGRGDIPDQQGLNRARLSGRGDGFRPTRGRSRTPSPRRRDVQSRDDLDRDMERFRDRERGFDGRDSWPVAEPPRGPAGWRDISPRRGSNFASAPSRERPREPRESEWDRKQRFNERNGTERFRDESRNM
ncbi:hypothetical protein BCR39DRAFT_375900 [Naematelia encephala]|uniref:Uncharacterized protein n=1 Tax=Naematelia encephala TaxID=71784 RepID=A0A1Y2BEN4_9TREE|nr:hypothetical protein BCR39DRAFT_375900 [Naematelia encephala]